MSGARSGAAFEVVNPRTGEVDHRFVAPSAEEVAATLRSLREAQPAWAALPVDARVEVLHRWRAELVARADEIVAALSTDTGRFLIAGSEFGSITAMIDRWSKVAPELLAEQPERRSGALASLSWRTQSVPYALVGVISPWNFPLTLSLIDAIPALLAGCAVYVKPSEITPRWVAPVRAAVAAVPELAAVLELEVGGRESGEAVVAGSDAVCFTGSVKTGRLVGEQAARHFIPAFLELGGKDPVIVTASADLDRAVDVVLRASCLATGQACQSLERVYVDRRVHDAFVERLAAKAGRIELNVDDIHRGILGPFIWARQAEAVAAQLDEARAQGARVLTGGEIIDRGGKWLAPTVLTGVTHEMRVMTDETFGPVMPVMAYDTIDEAVSLANEGIYGLSAAVIAGSLDEAEAIGRRLEVGAVSLNDGSLTGTMYEAEKNSFKLSGMGGSRMGPAGFTRFLRRKALIRQAGEPVRIEAVAEEQARR